MVDMLLVGIDYKPLNMMYFIVNRVLTNLCAYLLPFLSILLSKYPTAHPSTCLAAALARAGMLFSPQN